MKLSRAPTTPTTILNRNDFSWKIDFGWQPPLQAFQLLSAKPIDNLNIWMHTNRNTHKNTQNSFWLTTYSQNLSSIFTKFKTDGPKLRKSIADWFMMYFINQNTPMYLKESKNELHSSFIHWLLAHLFIGSVGQQNRGFSRILGWGEKAVWLGVLAPHERSIK